MSSTPSGNCPHTSEVGAYLLGCLHPDERADFASHLANCPECLREVGQLAGLPGLLSHTGRVSSDGSSDSDAEEPGPANQSARAGHPSEADQHGGVPPRLNLAFPVAPVPLPPASESDGEPSAVTAALAEVRRARARSRGRVAAALLLVAAVGIGGTVLVSRSAVAAPTVTGVSAAAHLPVQMQSMEGTKVSAALALSPRPWGTQVVMRCHYVGSANYQPPVLVLVARSADGSTTELARWTAVPNKDIVLASATELTGKQLAGLEVRETDGDVVLTADHI